MTDVVENDDADGGGDMDNFHSRICFLYIWWLALGIFFCLGDDEDDNYDGDGFPREQMILDGFKLFFFRIH